MIEIRTHQTKDQKHQSEFLVDDVVVKNVHLFSLKKSDEPDFWIAIYDQEVSERVSMHHFIELPADLERIELNIPFAWSDLLETYVYRNNDKHSFEIWFTFSFDFDNWKRLYSISEYVEQFIELLEVAENKEIVWKYDDEIKSNGFTIKFPIKSPQLLIRDEIERCSKIVQGFNEEVERLLISKLHQDSVAMYFDFPEEVKVPCEQYLLYFVQFLKDLGVDATAELQHQIGQVLFTVTPVDTRDALDRIRTALEVYINLPASLLDDSSTMNNDIAIQRLAGNIYHLKSQLSLAQAMLQAKDATIQAQLITIHHQQCLLSGEIIFDSLKRVTPQHKDEDKEELLGGTLAITKYKTKGVEINLPEIYRLLKRLITSEK